MPRVAQAHSASASAMPTLSSSRMKVSSNTTSRAFAMALAKRGKNSSPFSSRCTALPCVHSARANDWHDMGVELKGRSLCRHSNQYGVHAEEGV